MGGSQKEIEAGRYKPGAQHKLQRALFPPRRISGELCTGWLRLGHTTQDGQSDCLRCRSLGKNMAPGL